MDQAITDRIKDVDKDVQILIDLMIGYRQSASDDNKAELRYVSKKLDQAGKAIGLALDRIGGQ